MENGQSEFLQKYYDRERKITIIRAVATNKCLVLRNPTDLSTEGRAIRISSKSYSHQLAVEMFGRENIENICEDMPVHEADFIEDAYFREKRAAANDTAAAAPVKPSETAETPKASAPSSASKSDIVFSSAEIPPEIEGTNQCQDQFLVDCGANNAGVYDCVTGPSAVYRANTKCTGATQFIFSLKPRCSEFEDTKNARFIKCLQHFIFRKHFNTPDAPVVAGGGFQGGGLDTPALN
uniref:Uncharacterized protein n=1 Tax=Plectus sambesii TaxID=2011161 RepID=A0A914WCW6_9BILA